MTPLQEKMPAKLNRLPELAYNIWWSWKPEVRELFRRLDYPLWRQTQHNPVLMLREISSQKLDSRAEDPSFVRRYNHAIMLYDQEIGSGDHSWFHQTYPENVNKMVAYFSFEFGLHNSLPIYSGGLGILAGDHAKEASDLGIPFVGIGFMYPQGYFRQRIPSHGWQEAVYEQLDMTQAPIRPVTNDDDSLLKIHIDMDNRRIYARVWHVQVGRNPLYLLDTDVDENDPWDRELSARLYSGDAKMRIRQEIMLGIGGVRTLRALDIYPTVYHMNEGHSAFLALECMREEVEKGLSFEDALNKVRKHTVFTTHTPVPAGHDAFEFHLVDQHFNEFWQQLGISREDFLSLGWNQEEWGVAFNMTVLALRMSDRRNGVSKLHGEVSRAMWQKVWPEKEAEEVPIIHITNGIHVPTWISSDIHELFNKYLGIGWRENRDDPTVWERLRDIPDEELWQTHMVLKRKLLGYMQDRVRRNWVRGRSDATQVLTGGTLLNPGALTIGFARRFATYKRATLIFRDLERLLTIILDNDRPVQIIFAGKAHPNDDPGKHLIQDIYRLSQNNRLAGRVAFIEDYDMHIARYLKQGVDLWLNNPRRPREASGTSGMKTSLNGIPNLSVLDGWWAEGYNGANGWTIGEQKEYDDYEEQDWSDANSLYQALEEEIVPLYYNRDHDGIPRGWIEVMREAIRSTAPRFSVQRMLKDYANYLYVPAMQNGD